MTRDRLASRGLNVMRPLLWLHEQRIHLTAWLHARRMFRGACLSPAAQRALSAAAKRRTP
jgi:hypothetical protein